MVCVRRCLRVEALPGVFMRDLRSVELCVYARGGRLHACDSAYVKLCPRDCMDGCAL